MRAWSDTLRTARGRQRLSQRQLADRVGITQGHYSQVEAGNLLPSLRVFACLVEALGLGPDEAAALLASIAPASHRIGCAPVCAGERA